jgi:hypothetical protein
MDMSVYLHESAASEKAMSSMVETGGDVSSQVPRTRLDHAVVSMPEGMHEIVVQYHLVKLKPSIFQRDIRTSKSTKLAFALPVLVGSRNGRFDAVSSVLSSALFTAAAGTWNHHRPVTQITQSHLQE